MSDQVLESAPVQPAAPPPAFQAAVAAQGATRAQRFALLIGLLVVAYIALQLFASVLLPFVASAGIAYFLDPLATKLTRIGVPRRYAGILRAQAHEVDRILSAWLRGQAMCCIALALFYATALQFVGLDLGLIVGMAAGALSFIPYVGTISGAVTSILLAFAQFPTWTGVAMVGGVFVIGQVLEGYVIYPRFLGDRVELHAVWVIFALFAGGAAFGFVGVLLAVPVTAIIGVLCRFWLRRYLVSPLYLDPPGQMESGA